MMKFGIVSDDLVVTAVRVADTSVELGPADADVVITVGELALSTVTLGSE